MLCSVVVIDVNWLAAWHPMNWKDRQGIELGQVLILPKGQDLFNSLLILDRTGTGNVTPVSRHTAASAIENLLDTASQVSARFQLSQLPRLPRRRFSLI